MTRLTFANLLSTKQVLTDAAAAANAIVGPGKGGVHGTKVHTAFEAQVKKFDASMQLSTEVSYLNGDIAKRGTKDSVRLDVVEGPLHAPKTIYDLKTGSVYVSPERIKAIQAHLPKNFQYIPILEVR